MHYNLKFKAVGFSVPSFHPVGGFTYLPVYAELTEDEEIAVELTAGQK